MRLWAKVETRDVMGLNQSHSKQNNLSMYQLVEFGDNPRETNVFTICLPHFTTQCVICLIFPFTWESKRETVPVQ